MEQTKVIAKIHIPDDYNSKCTCDECGWEVPYGCSDSRVKVEIYDSINATEPVDVRMICEWCADEQFTNSEPHSIFG